MDFKGTIENGGVVLPTSTQQRHDSFLKCFRNGTPVLKSITRISKPGTDKQLKAFFGVAVKIVLDYLTEKGVTLKVECNGHTLEILPDKDSVKKMLYTVAPNNDKGEPTTLSSMNVDQRRKFYPAVQDLASLTWGLYIPDPDPNWNK